MPVKIYATCEPLAVDFIVVDDIDGSKGLRDSDDTPYFPEPKIFDRGFMTFTEDRKIILSNWISPGQ